MRHRFRLFSSVDPMYALDVSLREKVKQTLAARTFVHVTPEANLPGIMAGGLQTQFGGSDKGFSGINPEFRANSKNYVHLGKDDVLRWMPLLKPSQFYTRVFKNNDVRSYVLTVVLPNERVFSAEEAALEVQMHKASPLFAPDKAVMALVEAGEVKKDWADPLPGRYKTGSIPADFVFFKPFEKMLRAPRTVGVDEYVSPAVLDALVVAELSHQDKLEYLRGVVHATDESLYPVKP